MVGGGISGLSAAWQLRGRAEVTVFEPGRLGGCISTTTLGGVTVEEGPDAFLTRVPDAVRLCEEVGLGGDLVAPSAGRAALWWGKRLRPLPEGLVLGVPAKVGAVARSGILSTGGALRAALDLVLPPTPPRDGDTVRDLISRRFGPQVADRLVDPLVGGIHAGWSGELGAAETVPQLVEAARRSRSLLLGLRGMRAGQPGGGPREPVFLAPRSGLGSLVDALVSRLRQEDVRFVDMRADAVRSAGGEVRIDPHPEAFDAAVVATPATVASKLLGGGAAAMLDSIPTASVALVSLVVNPSAVPQGLSGFLVPRGQGKAMTACSFSSNKWPDRSGGEGKRAAVVRLSAGRYGDTGALSMDDGALVDRLVSELRDALGVPLDSGESRVSRWPGSFPQYLPGHASRCDAIDRAVRADHPSVTLAGSSYRGSGIPACIASGRAAAEAALASRPGLPQPGWTKP